MLARLRWLTLAPVVFGGAVTTSAWSPTGGGQLQRVDQAFAGLQQYFFTTDTRGASFWKACGQTGGNGGAQNHFECKCEAKGAFCINCIRWWMAVALQSLISLNQVTPGHASLNATTSMLGSMRAHSPYTTRAAPSWAYIDDYLWYVLMWLDSYRWLGVASDLDDAASTMELMAQWGTDQTCGGIVWMYPDVDPRKNSITLLEAVQATAQLAVALKPRQPVRALAHERRATELWAFFEGVHLIGDDWLVHDNVTGTAHGKFKCCNASAPPICEVRDSITWTYNQGMVLGAIVDMAALTRNSSLLHIGAKVLDAVVAHLTRGIGVHRTVLTEPITSFELRDKRCDATHDPSAPGGGDLFSFKAVFMNQLPRFLAAANGVLSATQLAAARQLVTDSANAAWSTRALPPFPAADICNEYPETPAGSPPKFSWDWAAPPTGGSLTCMDARTQAQALSLFVAEALTAPKMS
jgi:hypothetical protein